MLGHSHPYGPSASWGTGLGCSGPSWGRIPVRSSVLHWTHTCLISPSPPPFIYRSPASDWPPSRVFPLSQCANAVPGALWGRRVADPLHHRSPGLQGRCVGPGYHNVFKTLLYYIHNIVVNTFIILLLIHL